MGGGRGEGEEPEGEGEVKDGIKREKRLMSYREAGGKDNGKPGPRAYTKDYYGGFVLDPDGNNVEAAMAHHD